MKTNGRYFIDNPESGYFEVSKEYYEKYEADIRAFFDRFLKPNIEAIKGKIIITSYTPDEGDNGFSEFRKLWEMKG